MNNADGHHCQHETVRRVGRDFYGDPVYVCTSCGHRLRPGERPKNVQQTTSQPPLSESEAQP